MREVIDTRDNCPVCKEKSCSVKGHIISQARNECWRKEFNKKEKTPHLDYVKKNLKPKNKIIFKF